MSEARKHFLQKFEHALKREIDPHLVPKIMEGSSVSDQEMNEAWLQETLDVCEISLGEEKVKKIMLHCGCHYNKERTLLLLRYQGREPGTFPPASRQVRGHVRTGELLPERRRLGGSGRLNRESRLQSTRGGPGGLLPLYEPEGRSLSAPLRRTSPEMKGKGIPSP